MTVPTLLYRIVAARFVAGFEARADTGIVVLAAPIIRRATMGRRLDEVAALCRRNGWQIEPVAVVRCDQPADSATGGASKTPADSGNLGGLITGSSKDSRP